MRTVICFVLLASAIVGVANPVAARMWTDRATGRKLDAEFVRFADGKVEVKRAGDGKTFHVPLESLSDDDQAFVRAQTEPKTDSPLAKATPSQLLAGFTTSELTSELSPKEGKLLVAPDQQKRLEDWERNVAKGLTSGPLVVMGSGYEVIRLKTLDTHLGKHDKTTKETVTEIVQLGEGFGKPAPLETYWYGPVGFSFSEESLMAVFYRPKRPGPGQKPSPAQAKQLEDRTKEKKEAMYYVLEKKNEAYSAVFFNTPIGDTYEVSIPDLNGIYIRTTENKKHYIAVEAFAGKLEYVSWDKKKVPSKEGLKKGR